MQAVARSFTRRFDSIRFTITMAIAAIYCTALIMNEIPFIG